MSGIPGLEMVSGEDDLALRLRRKLRVLAVLVLIAFMSLKSRPTSPKDLDAADILNHDAGLMVQWKKRGDVNIKVVAWGGGG